ncbi:ubiquitin carboxyl-terminal hydrolase 21-like [Salvia miltiorrhiza]|uniref:ubiquitin carboxyl-terminal hydrolase 21-like n=1 Tax=Salvia miltiorrhiza TaxID=226208 RepID=UPI0025AD93E9|nr:ubiquitin carboxyl-terminal hydrolase 21-like [Salvia miltiorrhiza]
MDSNKTGEAEHAGSPKSPKTDEAERAGSEKSPNPAATSTDEAERAASESPKAAAISTNEAERAGSEKSSKVAATSTDEAESAGSEKSPKPAATSTDEAELAGSKKSPNQAATSTGEAERAASESPKAAAISTNEAERAGSEKSSKVAATSTDEAESAGSEKSPKPAATSTDEAELAGSKKSPNQAATSTGEAERAGSGKSPKAAATSTDEAARGPPELTQAQKELCASIADFPWGNIFAPFPYTQPKESHFVKGLYVSSSEEDDGNGDGDGDVDLSAYANLKVCETGPTTPTEEEQEALDQESVVAALSKPPPLLQNMQIDGFDSTNYEDFDPYDVSPPPSQTYRTQDFDITTFLREEDAFRPPPEIPTQQPRMDYALIGGGLSNINNTCFINAILQCLVHTVPFLEGIRSKCSCDDQTLFCPWCCLQDLFLLLTTGLPYVAPNTLVSNMHHFSEHFQKGLQADAHEFLSKARSVLMECHADGTALIRRVFGGRLFNKYTCRACRNFTGQPEDMLDLQLPITKDAYSLLNALREYTENEVSDYRCEKCGTSGEKTVHNIQLDQLPHILTFQLKRFDGVQKIIRELPFPLEMDLVTFTVTQDVKCEYHLYAIVVHMGQTTISGHYYSFIRVSATDWYEFNDEMIKRVDEEHVLTQEAYILFYAKEGTPWFSEAMQAHKASTSSQPPGDNVPLIPSEGDDTAMTFFPEYTDWQPSGRRGAGKGPISGWPKKGG